MKEIVPKSDSDDVEKAVLSVTGPKEVTAGDTSLPPYVKAIDDSQYILTITQPISLDIELSIQKDCGYRIGSLSGYRDGELPVDAVSMPVRNVNCSVHLFGSGRATRETSFIEIWTNGSLTPYEAIKEASKKLIDLPTPFLQMKNEDVYNSESGYDGTPPGPSSQIYDVNKQLEGKLSETTFIDQLELPARALNCLKKAKIHTIANLLSYNQEDS